MVGVGDLINYLKASPLPPAPCLQATVDRSTGTWYLVPGFLRYLVPGTWYLAGTWYQVPGLLFH